MNALPLPALARYAARRAILRWAIDPHAGPGIPSAALVRMADIGPDGLRLARELDELRALHEAAAWYAGPYQGPELIGEVRGTGPWPVLASLSRQPPPPWAWMPCGHHVRWAMAGEGCGLCCGGDAPPAPAVAR